MNIEKIKKFFSYNIFYSLLILLLVISFTFQNIVIAQNTNQEQSNNSTEHFSLVLSLDPEGEAIVNYTFQQNNLLAIVYGKSNLKVIDLDTENIIYEISSSKSNILLPCLVDNYLLYYLSGQKETIRVDLSITEKEGIGFPGSSYQITDDGYLITHYGNLCQLIDLDDGQVLFKPDVSKSGRGKILCVDDVIIFPVVDSRGNSIGYKAMSTDGEVKFTLKESFNEVCIFLPEYHSKISTFPLPILINRNYRDKNREEWFLEFINKEGRTINSYSPADLGIDYSWNRVNSPLWVLDEYQDNFLLQISCWKEGESQTKFYYILTDLSGNVVKVFDKTSNCFAAIDNQGNILLHQIGGSSNVLNYYQQDGTPIFNKQIPCLLEVSSPKRFNFLSKNEILEWEYGRFEKYSLTNGKMTGIYPISTDYQIYLKNTIINDNKVYFFARPRPGFKPKITGSNYFSFSAADSGWLDIELVSIRPNAGTTYEVWDNTEVKVKFRTEYGTSFGENLSVNFEKGEVLAANDRDLEYTWHTPAIISGSQDTAKMTVSYGPVSQEFIITIKDHLPTASFTFNPSSPQTEQNVHFDGSLSADLDGEISAYHWDFGDGTVELKQEQDYIDHIFSTAGDYIVTLVVTDNNSQTTQISQNIKVTAAPKSPVADFKLLDPSPQWDTKVRFDASLSSDPDGSIISYQWDFGDGTTEEGINVSHEFKKYDNLENRNFDVTLTVTDDQSLSSSKTMKITYGWILSYENKGDIGIPAALVDGNNLVDYQVTVITGDCDGAGTGSRVFIALYGHSSENDDKRYGSGENQLSHIWSTSDFEKGNTDVFSVKGYHLDEIGFITLRHTNENSNPEWYVKAVKVKNQNNQEEWLFVPDQWLGTNKPPDYQAWGKFVPVEPYQYGIFFKGDIPAKRINRITNNIFILYNSIETFYFTCLDKSKKMEVYKKLAQDVNINISPNGIFVGRQEVRGEGLCDPNYLAERDFGVQYEASILNQPTQFLIRIKDENGNWEEKTIWIFPVEWQNYKRTARQVTLLYPLKGNNELFEYGQRAADYLEGIQIKPNLQPIIDYGIAALGIFGDIPDNTFRGELENSVERIMKEGAATPIAVKILTKLTGKVYSAIISEAFDIITTLHKARDWAEQMYSVINKSIGDELAVDIYLNIPSKAGNFKNSNNIFSSLSEKISSLIGTIENNNVTGCESIIEEIEMMTVGSINAITETEIETNNSDYYKINYQTLGIQGDREGYPLFILLMLEKNRIEGWKDEEGKEEYYSKTSIDMTKALYPNNYNGYLQAGHEVALETYEPIIDNLIKNASIFINISLLD